MTRSALFSPGKWDTCVRLLVISSCTGLKSVDHPRRLTRADFQRGPEHLARRHRRLAAALTTAESLYRGQHHVRLMRGVEAFRRRAAPEGTLRLLILSAGYGLVPSDQELAPYECTFQGMKASQLQRWSRRLRVPEDFRAALSQTYDLGIVALSADYLKACELAPDIRPGGPTLLLCGGGQAAKTPKLTNLRPIVLANSDARRFACGQVALKGEIAGRMLARLAGDANLAVFQDPAADILEML